MIKNILITGSGSGIGRDAALQLARRGHTVYATTQYESQANHLNRVSKRYNLPLKAFKLDILNTNDRQLVHQYKIDVLINNATIGQSGSVAEVPLERYRKTFETNVFSMIALTQEVLKDMITRKEGRVIFVSSLARRMAFPFFSPYIATKHAIEGINTSLKSEMKSLRKRGIEITVSIISPGTYATGFNQKMMRTKYEWMNESSYFANLINFISLREEILFYLLEKKSNRTIVREYIKSVEDNKLKSRYSSPKLQAIIAQLISVLTGT